MYLRAMAIQAEDLMRSGLHHLLSESKGSLCILITGRVGTGKSALVNSLVGEYVAEERGSLQGTAEIIRCYTRKVQNVTMTIYDTRGFEYYNSDNDSSLLVELNKVYNEVDVNLYCLKMNDRFRPTEKDVLKILSHTFGMEKFLKKTLFVFTFANEVKPPKSLSKTPQEYFKQRKLGWKRYLQERLEKIGITSEVAQKVPVIPAGYSDNLSLPAAASENWLNTLWSHILHVHRTAKPLVQEAISRGYVEIRIAITVVVGPAGVGKTCLKFLLLRKPPPGVRNSTPGAEAPIRIQIRTVSAERFRKLGDGWQEVRPDEMLPLIARYIRSIAVEKEEAIPEELKEYLEKIETLAGDTASQDEASGIDSGSPLGDMASALGPFPDSRSASDHTGRRTGKNNSKSTSQSSSKSGGEAATLKKTIDGIMRKLEKLVSEEGLSKEDAEMLFSREWVYFTDSGGQPQFHEVLPLFICDVSSVVIVTRLSDRLDQYPTDEYYMEGKLVGKCELPQLTCEDQIKCLIQSLLSRKSTGECPNVIVVGTHYDKASDCDETIEEKDEKLIKMFGSEFKKQLAYYQSPKKLLFPLNALEPNADDHAVAGSIRFRIESSNAKEVKVPIQWYILECLIRGLATELDKRVLSKILCKDLAHALNITDASFEAALHFFNELNVLKYSDVLPEVVFVDSQVPLDKISELVQHSYERKYGRVSTPCGECSVSDHEWERFCKEGVVNLNILRSFRRHYVKGLFEVPSFLELLQELLVAVPLVHNEYFMPALLDALAQKELQEHRIEHFSSKDASLLFRFSHGCRQAGVFCCLVVHLMKHKHWSLQNAEGNLIQVSRNLIKFRLYHKPCLVTLIDSFHHLEVHVSAPLSLLNQVCPTIRQEVLDGIKEACSKLHYCDDSPSPAVFCPLHTKLELHSAASEEWHAAVITGEYCECIKAGLSCDLSEAHKIWLNPAQVSSVPAVSPLSADVAAQSFPQVTHTMPAVGQSLTTVSESPIQVVPTTNASTVGKSETDGAHAESPRRGGRFLYCVCIGVTVAVLMMLVIIIGGGTYMYLSRSYSHGIRTGETESVISMAVGADGLDNAQYPTSGDEITRLRDLVHAVRDIGDWKGLCMNLDVDLGTMEHIEYSSTPNKKLECLTAYLKQGEANWNHVVRAVAMLGNKRVARKIAQKHGIDFEKVVRDEF